MSEEFDLENCKASPAGKQHLDSIASSSEPTFAPSYPWASSACVPSLSQYQKNYELSVNTPSEYWAKVASEGFHFQTPWTNVLSYNFDIRQGPIFCRWFEDATTNLCYNALDRHVIAGGGDRIAFLWEGNNLSEERQITYKQLLDEVCRFANVLKSYGVRRGDTIAIYMPMVVELPVAMLACARIGAVHSVVFGGFSAESLASRIADAKAKILITADGVFRGPKAINLKLASDEAMDLCQRVHGFEVQKCIVYRRLGASQLPVTMKADRDVWWQDIVPSASTDCPVEWMGAEDPLFMLYTSGSTGKPKGVLHTTAGYMVYASTTFANVFDYRADDIYFCTADAGWITGHSYVVYGPLCNGATSVIFEGIPTHPGPSRMWQIVEKYKVSIFYTAPTAIRALMRYGDAPVKAHDRSSLRILGTVGEPINAAAWLWYYQVVGDSRCPIVDTWWQTETGGLMISPLPAATPLKPGSASLPLFGVQPVILDDKGKELTGTTTGFLAIRFPWPGMLRTVFGDHARFEQTYFSMFPGYFITGDGCRRDEDGFYWLTGRVDDVLNVSGHRLGTAEVESALVSHPHVAEAAVVPVPHDLKGEGIYCYVTCREGVETTVELRAELISTVRRVLGPIATPDQIHWAPGLPKTRSGKIMRRILRKIATKELESLGDVSTLADPSIVQTLIDSSPK